MRLRSQIPDRTPHIFGRDKPSSLLGGICTSVKGVLRWRTLLEDRYSLIERSRLQHSKSSVFENIRSVRSYKRIVAMTTGVRANACCMYEETCPASQTAHRPAGRKGANHAP